MRDDDDNYILLFEILKAPSKNKKPKRRKNKHEKNKSCKD